MEVGREQEFCNLVAAREGDSGTGTRE